MKKLFIIIALLFSVSVYSQDSSRVADTSKLTFTKVYNDVKAGVAGLASVLKVGASHVYEVLVKQQVVKSITYLIIITVLSLLIFYLYKLSRKTYNAHLKQAGYDTTKAKESNYDIDIDDSALGIASCAIAVIAIVLLIGTIIFTCNVFTDIITGFVNPEYGAMKDIVNFIK